MCWRCVTAVAGSSSGAELLTADSEVPCFTLEVALDWPDTYTFDLILFDCQKGQIIDPLSFNPGLSRDPPYVHLYQESQGNLWTSRQHMAFAQRPKDSVLFPKLHANFSVFLVDLGKLRRSTGNTDESEGRWCHGASSNIFPSSLCPLSESSDHQRMGPSPYICRFDAY